jgi:hypothetical protein
MKTMKMKTPAADIEIDWLLTDVQKMLYKQAWDAAARYNLPFDECLSECYWGFVRAVNWRFDASKGLKFSSEVFLINAWRFKTKQRRELRDAERFPLVELNEETAGFAVADRAECLEAVEGLSEEAREIVGLLLDTPKELLEDLPTPKQLLKRVKAYLQRRGHHKRDLLRAQEEITRTFRAVWATA